MLGLWIPALSVAADLPRGFIAESDPGPGWLGVGGLVTLVLPANSDRVLPKNFSQKKNWRAINWTHGTPNHPHLSCLPGAALGGWRKGPKGPELVSLSGALVGKGSVQSSVWQEHGSEQAVRAAPRLGWGRLLPHGACSSCILQVSVHSAWHWSPVEATRPCLLSV